MGQMGRSQVMALILSINLVIVFLAAYCCWRWYMTMRTRLSDRRRLHRHSRSQLELQPVLKRQGEIEQHKTQRHPDTPAQPQNQPKMHQSKSTPNQKPKQKAESTTETKGQPEWSAEAQDSTTTPAPGSPQIATNDHISNVGESSNDNGQNEQSSEPILTETFDQGAANQGATTTNQSPGYEQANRDSPTPEEPTTSEWHADDALDHKSTEQAEPGMLKKDASPPQDARW